MFGLESIIPPYYALTIVADDIEKQLLFVIDKYVMIYNGQKNTVEFKLNDEEQRRPLPNPALCDALKMYLSPYISEGFEIEYAMIFFYRDNSQKMSGIDLHLIKKDEFGNIIEKKRETIKL